MNFNGQATIGACLASLTEQTRPADEIIVVDNHSNDGSAGIVAEAFPSVKLIRLTENAGYAAACNRGIAASQGDLVAVLNNDLVLDPQWLESILEYNADPWDFWASRILFADPPHPIDSAGDGMAVVGTAYKRGHGKASDTFESTEEVFGPCGAAAVYRRTLLEATGGFDEDFFLIYEDADMSMRARMLGHRCLYVSSARVFHHVNQSIGTFSDTYVFYGHRNSEFVFWKNFPAPLLLLYLPERVAFNFLSLIYFGAHGRGGSFLRAKLAFLKGFPSLWRKRRQIQSERKLRTSEVRRLLDRNWLRYRRKVKKAP